MLSVFTAYVIVGHSERRTLYGEGDEVVARKFAAARKVGVKPILCVGETLEERDQGITEAVVERQLKAVLAVEGIEAFNDAVIAYEPVWSLALGEQRLLNRLRMSMPSSALNWLSRIQRSQRNQDLYGGSMKAANAKGTAGYG